MEVSHHHFVYQLGMSSSLKQSMAQVTNVHIYIQIQQDAQSLKYTLQIYGRNLYLQNIFFDEECKAKCNYLIFLCIAYDNSQII